MPRVLHKKKAAGSRTKGQLDAAMPQAAVPSRGELDRLGRLADRIAAGKEPLTRVKI